MNARVDPAALAAPAPDNDERLVALCRAAIRAIDTDIDCETMVHDIEAAIPPYPSLDWRFSPHQDTSRSLRRVLKERGRKEPLSWRRHMRTQIDAVAKWEQACKAIEKELKLGKVMRMYDTATALSLKYVVGVAATPATTVKGAAWKATVSARWIAAGYTLGADAGEELVQSILHDIRALGSIGGNAGRIKLARRKATA